MKKIGACVMLVLSWTVTHAQADLPEKLPLTRPCVAEDLAGLKKLKRLFEKPEAEETKNLKANPQQFLYFGEKQVLVDLQTKTKYTDPAKLDEALRARMRQQVKQVVLGEKGVYYVYLNSQPVESHYCMIVTKQEGAFRKDDLLLMKTDQQTGTGLTRVYAKHTFDAAAETKRNTAARRADARGKQLEKSATAQRTRKEQQFQKRQDKLDNPSKKPIKKKKKRAAAKPRATPPSIPNPITR